VLSLENIVDIDVYWIYSFGVLGQSCQVLERSPRSR